MNLPPIGTILDSIGDGLVEVAKLPIRIAKGVNSVGGTYLNEVDSNLGSIQSGLPQNPMVLPETGLKAFGQTASLGIGVLKAVGDGVQGTLDGVQGQVRRVIR